MYIQITLGTYDFNLLLNLIKNITLHMDYYIQDYNWHIKMYRNIRCGCKIKIIWIAISHLEIKKYGNVCYKCLYVSSIQTFPVTRIERVIFNVWRLIDKFVYVSGKYRFIKKIITFDHIEIVALISKKIFSWQFSFLMNTFIKCIRFVHFHLTFAAFKGFKSW